MFTKRDIAVISNVHETVVRQVSHRLSEETQFRNKVSFHIASVDQLMVEEFLRSIPVPTYIVFYEMSYGNKRPGWLMVEMDRVVIHSLVAALCQINPKLDLNVERGQFTDFEQLVVHKVFDEVIIPQIKESWKFITDVKIERKYYTPNLEHMAYVNKYLMGSIVTMECKIDNNEGMFNLYYDEQALKFIKDLKRGGNKNILVDKVYNKIDEVEKSGSPNILDVDAKIGALVDRQNITIKSLLDCLDKKFIPLTVDNSIMTVNDVSKYRIQNEASDTKVKVKIKGVL